MRKTVKLKAFAKANLSLDIVGKKSDMHTIDSIMISVDKFDTVFVSERDDDKITVCFDGCDIDPVHNTAYKAASLVRDKIGCGVDIRIQKGIPVGAGLGGSSADGAAVLRALDAFYRLPSRGVGMRELALAVGSDVPFMLTGGTARVRGMGEDLFFIDNKLPLFGVGLMRFPVSTAKAYAEYDKLSLKPVACDNEKLVTLLMNGDKSALELFTNALYEPARRIEPSVAELFEKLKSVGATPVMTGSGGMVMGWFTDIESFARAAHALKGEEGFCAIAPTRVGILHEWVDE